jgi:uncharacterized membrane protein YkvA (DUF1232 family)
MKNRYSRHYNERSLSSKIGKFSVKAGQKVIYAVLLLYYVMKDKQVALKTKLTIVAALGYFIAPVDLIFDLAPIFGFTDDLGVLVVALIKVSRSVTPAIKLKARQKMHEWFSEVDEKKLLALENKFSGGGKE